MAHYHPMYGQLLNSREVSDLTGYTMNQLRYFRQHPERSPFPLLKQGTTTFYREADVRKYVEQSGAIDIEYIVPDGFDPEPLVNPNYVAAKKGQYDQLAKITTANAWSKWTEKLTLNGGMDINEAYQFIADEQVRLYELATGDNLRKMYGEDVDYPVRKNDPLRYWPSRTYGIRSLARKIYGWEVTDEDILNVPIGEVPPSKIE